MIFDPLLDLFRGKAVTIPPMDGALRPNTLLEDADVRLRCQAPDNLVETGGKVLFSSGHEVLELGGRKGAKPKQKARFDNTVSALAASEGGLLAVGLDSGGIEILGPGSARKFIDDFACPVALTFTGERDLFVCNGSQEHRPGNWAMDLMEKNALGSVWHVSLASGERKCLASGLAFPFGIAMDAGEGRLIVSESWRHRLIAIPAGGGEPVPLVTQLPGYPARLAPREGGYLLSLFAPRNRLVEFVLLEDDYRADMMREIDPPYWIAPALSASRSFLEPLQCGGVRTMGIHKPWSPSRSWGLVVELDPALQPVGSYHSRANGTRHGITSAIMHAGSVLAASKGGDVILAAAPSRDMVEP